MSTAVSVDRQSDRVRASGPGRLPDWLLVGVGCLALAAIADLLLRHEHGMSGDEPYYALMAAHPGAAHSFPYAYRIAVPWIVWALPFSQVVAFQGLALVCIAASGAALYVLMRQFGISVRLAALLAAGCAISPNLLVVLLRHGRSIDPATTLVMILGCLFVVRRQRLALALTVLIGVAVKETSLFLLPLAYAVWARRLVDPEALRDTVLVAIAPVAGYLAIRAAVPAVGNQYTPEYGGSFLAARAHVFRQVFTAAGLRRVAYAFGPLWLLAPFALRTLPFARRGLVLVGLCVLAMTVSFDAGRIIFLAVPVFYVAAAWVADGRPRLAAAAVAALFAVNVIYAVYMQVHGVQHGLDSPAVSPIPLR